MWWQRDTEETQRDSRRRMGVPWLTVEDMLWSRDHDCMKEQVVTALSPGEG